MECAGWIPRRNVVLWPWCPVGLEEQALLSIAVHCLLKGMLGHTVPMGRGQPHPSAVAPLGCLPRGHMLEPQECTKLQLDQSPIPRNRPLPVAAVAHPASRCLLACLPDALLCTDSPRDRLSDSSDPKGRLLYIFFQPLF